MDSDPSSDDEPEKSTNAFKLMMQPPPKKAKVEQVDPIVIAVIYIRWLKWIDPSEPLYGLPYVGQAVRAKDTAEEVAVMRWKEENLQAVREDKDIGLIHCLDMYGPAAFDDQVVEWKRGPRSEVQEWANKREIALIAEQGGPLRDHSVRCKQTLNLTKGGKWGCNFEAIDALRTAAWLRFKTDIGAYVECYETSLVPHSYVDPVSGHKLGAQLRNVRHGHLFRGHPDEASRVAWLESLPGWAWKPLESDEWKQQQARVMSECHSTTEAKIRQSVLSKALWANADDVERANWCKNMAEAHNRPDVKAKHSKSAKAQWANADKDTHAKWVRNMSKAASTPDAKARSSTFRTAWWKNADDETKKERSRKHRIATIANRAKVLEGLPPLARKEKNEKYARTDREEASRKGRANALLQLPEYANQGYYWCYLNLPQAKKDGVVFSKDANGVWSARVFERASSSAEHGAHV